MGGDNWQEKLHKAKRLHRPSLKDWTCDELYDKFPEYLDSVSAKEETYRSFLLPYDQAPRNLPIILDAKTLTADDFHHNYEGRETPCIIKNIPLGYDGGQVIKPWPALEKWSIEQLRQNEHLLERKYKCGEDDDGDNIKVKLKHFLNYQTENRDDSPLYIFDSSFENDQSESSILHDYRVPSYFRDDLFGLVSESRRPPYRWFLVGPERSGTCVHIDPLATNAWNTLIFGRKRWVLFPPHVPKHIVKGRGLIRDDEDDEAIHYFMYILPRIKRKARSLRDHVDYRNFATYEFTQQPGETVFVPNGWWHAVLNLTHTVGITQNYCSRRNFEKVWLKTRTGRKRMAWKWLCALQKHHPDLAKHALALNTRDYFVMKYDPVEVKRREADKARRKSKAEKKSSV